jgi:hypothetical protein
VLAFNPMFLLIQFRVSWAGRYLWEHKGRIGGRGSAGGRAYLASQNNGEEVGADSRQRKSTFV